MFLMLSHFLYFFPFPQDERNSEVQSPSEVLGKCNCSGPKHSQSNLLHKKAPFCLNTEAMYCLLFLNSYTKKCKFNQMLDYYSWDTVNKQVRENVKEGQEGYCHKQDTVISDAEFLRK